MQLTQATDYALRSLMYLAGLPSSHEESAFIVVSAQEIADYQNVPLRFLLKIMRQLSKADIVKSRRGNMGGYILAKSPSEITLLQIIEAIEGPVFINRCLVRPELCNRDASANCGAHVILRNIQDTLNASLSSYTLADFIA